MDNEPKPHRKVRTTRARWRSPRPSGKQVCRKPRAGGGKPFRARREVLRRLSVLSGISSDRPTTAAASGQADLGTPSGPVTRPHRTRRQACCRASKPFRARREDAGAAASRPPARRSSARWRQQTPGHLRHRSAELKPNARRCRRGGRPRDFKRDDRRAMA
jgi:hypothetical protein